MRLEKSVTSLLMSQELHEDCSHSESRCVFLLSRNPTVSFNSWIWNRVERLQSVLHSPHWAQLQKAGLFLLVKGTA